MDTTGTSSESTVYARRRVLKTLTTLGIGSITFRRALAASAEQVTSVTPEMIEQAEWIAGIQLTDEQRKMAADGMANLQDAVRKLREAQIDYSLPPALVFRPLEDTDSIQPSATPNQARFSESATLERPDLDDLAFLPVGELSALIRRREVSSSQLTRLYLDRLQRFDPLLKCVVTITEDVAMRQARRADRELAAGQYRGPLHGIPWGAKDLMAYPGYTTTWGAPQFRQQRLEAKASVAARLEQAGAVMIAKLTLGSYALGDQWFGGKTRNPWNPMQGSSGSSAGSASATAAGLVGFSIGSETMGSIISPSRRCGASGLRPTFGRVSRYGCMPLSWSLDKIGPICRSVEDCCVVLGAIHGADPRDPTTVDREYVWPSPRDLGSIRVGFVESDDGEERPEIRTLRQLGFQLIPVPSPKSPLTDQLRMILTAEAASIFDELTHQGQPKGVKHWPKTFATGQFISANDYLKANRVRRLLMEHMRKVMSQIDVLVGGDVLVETNLSGHPQITVPNGLQEKDGFQVPRSLLFTGRLYDEPTMAMVAHAYQLETGHHLPQPNIDEFLRDKERFVSEPDTLDEDRLYDC